MSQNLRRRLAPAGMLLALALVATATARPAGAQGPTPEGTVITNTATASWTDANNNTYANVSASASVTVGFLPGPDVSVAASSSPASPSTGNTLTFTIANTGNGTDSVTVGSSAAAGLTITGYVLGGVTYPTLVALNLQLSQTPIAAGGSITVDIVYNVGAGYGGQTLALGLTATSRRDPSATSGADTANSNITPGVAAAVDVTPDGATVSRLPSNGTQYTAQFTVTNNGNAADNLSLAASANPGAALAIVSVNGTAGSAATISLAVGASQTVDVIYTVANGAAAGASEVLTLAATSGNNGAISENGTVTVTVIRAAVAMTKEVYRDDQSTAITAADRVKPGDYMQYKISVSNAGAAGATSVEISDPLPPQVTYVSAAGDAAGWAIDDTTAPTIKATLAALAPGDTRFVWIRVQVK